MLAEMSCNRTSLKALVVERLTAAADHIFALFETTISEYEEEVRKCREIQCANANANANGIQHVEQSEATPQPLDLDMGLDLDHSLGDTKPWSKWTQTEDQGPFLRLDQDHGPVLRLDQDLSGFVQIKQEPKEPAEIKQEQDPLIQAVPEFSFVCGKTEDPQMQSPDLDVEDSVDPDVEDWAAPFRCSETGNGKTQHTTGPSSVLTQTQTEKNTKKKKFRCHICQRFLSSKHHLESHLGAHLVGKPYPCSHCTKAYVYQNAFDHHMWKHHRRFLQGKKRYLCQVCNKLFSNTVTRQKHVRAAHMGEALLTCEFCGMSFTSRHELKKHSATHTGNKPFSCLFCNEGFFQKSDLIEPKKRHSGEKPFSCLECGKSFMFRKPFDMHLEKHNEQQREN